MAKTAEKSVAIKPITGPTVEACEKYTANIEMMFHKLADMVEQIKKQPASHAAQEYVLIKNLADEYESIGKVLNEFRDLLKTEVLPKSFERDGITSFNTFDGFRVTMSQSVRCKILDKVLGYKYLRDNNLGDIVTETVNSSTLAAVARTMLEEGKELPPEFFETYLQPSTSVTKTKKAA